jgi:hypothetical protein
MESKDAKDSKSSHYLSEGRYGCVYQPPLKCKQGTEKGDKKAKGKMVSKLTTKDDAEHELESSNFIFEVPGADKYFVNVNSICEPEETNDLDQCYPTTKENFEDLRMLTMPYGGITLQQVREKLQEKLIENFMFYSQCLLEAGVFLLMKNLVHFDLHMNNVLILERPRIIDLGFIWTPLTLNEGNIISQLRLYNPQLDQESPEASYINGSIPPYTIRKDILIHEVVNRKLVFKDIHMINGTTHEKQEQIFGNFVNNSRLIENKDIVGFFKTYWSKFDAWGFGTLITKMLVKSMFDKSFVDTVYKPNKVKIDKVITGLTCPDPGLRLDVVEALQILNPSSTVLSEPSVASWFSKQSAYRQKLSSLPSE